MGALVEQSLATLFGGVSRQPALVRQSNQAEAADNTLFSVVTGGYEKRPPLQTVAWLNFLDPTQTYFAHPIDRDATEQTFLLASDGEILAVNAITGAQVTVSVGDTKRYYLIEEASLDSTGIVQIDAADMSIKTVALAAETTFDWGWKLSDATTGRFKVEGSVDGVTWNDIQTGVGGAGSGTFSTTIDAVATGDHNYLRVSITTGMATADDTLTLWATFKDLTYLDGVTTADLRFISVADNTFVTNRNIMTRLAEADSGTVTSTVQEFSDLPAASGSGNIHAISGTDANGFGKYFVIDDSATSTFIETTDPNAHNEFDQSSMPHRLVRATDGTFTFSAADWTARQVGDEEVTEAPTFIGKTIQDVTFYRNRLTFVADEEIYCSQAGNVLDMWPEKAVEVLDSDPVTRAATTNEVNILKFATVFRKILFATSVRAQFELSSEGSFTPESALFDQATSYTASPIAKPTAMGDVLYFPSTTPSFDVIYEYFFDDSTLSNTAANVSKHVVDYIASDILEIVTDPTTGTVFVLSSGLQNGLYVYRTFFDGAEKVQSAWCRYIFGATESDAFIHGIAVMSGFLVLVIERDDGEIYLEQMPIERETQNTVTGYTPFLDQREVLTATYDSTNEVSTWQTSYEHQDDVQVILGPSFSEGGIELTTLFYPDKYVLTLASVLAGETLIVNGLTFTAHATTTTAANREFDISGNDITDAGELTTLLNDATYGILTSTATDNGDGTITVLVDDAADGSISAWTGTAITNATVVATEIDDLVAARTDYSANPCWLGRMYEMSYTFSQQYWREQANSPANLTGRLQLRDISLNVQDTGYLKITVTPTARTAYVYTFEGKTLGESTTLVGSASIATTAKVKVPIWTNAETVDITVSNDQPGPSIVTSAAWRGFFNELSRQE